MFKLLAIRPLPGCVPHIQKCLKTGIMYYFCNDYIIEPYSHIRRRSKNIKPLKEDFFSLPFTNDGLENNQSMGDGPIVSVSAIVGMNGDGKSTLVELMMRLINNCAISYKLYALPENLRRVEGVKAELYYLIDNILYLLVEDMEQDEAQIYKMADLNKNSENNELMRWEMTPKAASIIVTDVSFAFFYSIISNYSHYAYNTNDYKNEWERRGGEQQGDEKCWLHYLFNKNDGYLTPISLHPSRERGNVEINNEEYLSKQRLLSLFLNADNPSDNPHSFRRVNGKDANYLKLTEESSSKLQQRSLIYFFEATKQERKFQDVLDRIDFVNHEGFRTSMLLDSYDEYHKYYNDLFDFYLPKLFLNPINKIIEQDNGAFSNFADDIVNWINKYREKQNDGDIISIINGYESLLNRNEAYIRISRYTQHAKREIKTGNYSNAALDFKRAIEISEHELGEMHVVTALVYDDYALLTEKLGHFDEALTYYNKAIIIKEESFRKRHPSLAITCNNVAGVYRVKGDYDKAFSYCSAALNILEPQQGVYPFIAATTYRNSALLAEESGNDDVALQLFSNSLSLYESSFSALYDSLSESSFNAFSESSFNAFSESSFNENRLDSITTNIIVAEIFRDKEDHAKASEYFKKALYYCLLPHSLSPIDSAKVNDSIAWIYLYYKEGIDTALGYYEKALDIRKNIFGNKHQDIALSYYHLGWTYYEKGNLVKALSYFEGALKIRKNVLGLKHRETASVYDSIAWIHFAQDSFDDALTNYKHARDIRRSVLGDKHRDTAMTFFNLASVYLLQESYKRALDNYMKALDIWGDSNLYQMNFATTYNNMAWAYYRKGDFNQALSFFKKAKGIREKQLGKFHPNTTTTYSNIAMVYRALNDHKNALDYYEKALKGVDSNTLNYAKTHNAVAWEYYHKGSYDKALESYLMALSILEKNLGTEHPDTIHYYKIIAGIYKVKGIFEKACEYYYKALKQSDSGISAIPDETVIDTIIVYSQDEYLIQYEMEDFLQQISPQNKHEFSGKTEMAKIQGNTDIIEKVYLKMKEQKLINTKEYSFLTSINATQLGRLDSLYRIMKSYGIDWKIVTKNFSDLSIQEKCQHYIVYKVCSILSHYPDYRDAFQKEGIYSIREFGGSLEECIDMIKSDNESHITRKLRQVENFIQYGLEKGGLYEELSTTGKKDGVLMVELDKLREHYGDKSFSLDNLPPPIYKWDVVFDRQDDSNCLIDLDSFSSGEKQLLNSMGSIIYHLQNLANSSSKVKYYNVNLILEEIELYYHPEYQRLFFNRLLDLINRADLKSIHNINIVFVTHSPFILSDIPKSNVLFLKDGMPKDIMQENTFGANIHTLLKNGFFMPNLPIGDFAYKKINNLFGKLNSGEFNPDTDLDDIYQEILLVGEPFLRNQLLILYNSYKGAKQLPKN